MQVGLNQTSSEPSGSQSLFGRPSATRWPSLSILLDVLKPELSDYWVLISYSVLIGIIGLAVPIAVQSYVNTVAFGSLFQPIIALAIFLLVVLGFSAVFQALNLFVIEILHRRLIVRFCARYVSHLPNLAKETKRDSLHLSNKFFEVAYFQKILTGLLVEGFALLLQTTTGLLLLAFYHPALLALDLFILASTFLAFYSFGSKGSSFAIEESHQRYAIGEWFQDLALSSTSFRTPSALDYARKKTDHLIVDFLKIREKAFRYPFMQYIGCLAIYAIGSAGLLGVGGYLVMKEQLTLGQLIAAEIVLTAILGSIAKFGGKLSSYYDILASGEKLSYVLLAESTEGQKFSLPPEDPPKFHLKVDSFHGFSADWHNGTINHVLGSAKIGEYLFQTLNGDLAAVPGQISWGGVEIELIPKSLRARSVIHVSGPRLIPGTVIENLTLGRQECDPAEIESAVKTFRVFERISALPQGFHTELSPNDTTLTFEDGLRLGIARAVLEKPRILILTEIPTLLSETAIEDLVMGIHSALPNTIVVLFGEKPLAFLKNRHIRLQERP